VVDGVPGDRGPAVGRIARLSLANKVKPSPIPILLMARQLTEGGSERQMTELARSMDRTRFMPHVACVDARGSRATDLREAEVPILELPIQSLASMQTFKISARLRSYVGQRGIRLIHAFDPPMSFFAATAGRLSGAKVILTSQRCFEDTIFASQRKQVRVAHRLSDGVVANAEAVRQHLLTDYGLTAKKIRICHNGIDASRYAGARRRCGPFADGGIVIGTVCVLRPEKAVNLLLEAFSRIASAVPRARLLVVGSGPELWHLEELRAKLGLGDKVHFEPATTEVGLWMKAMDIFVLPSLSEAFSNSIMEAMASGCAVIASNVGGNPELVEHGVTGLLFERNNPEDLARQLSQLVDDSSLRTKLAEAGRDRIAREFSLVESTRRMEAIYDEYL
jgi:glycosyltransferase involved in cell wall biosynthesis